MIGVLFITAVFTACGPSLRESERMEAALQRADSIYCEGENDTALFIPGLAEASAYFADKKQYGKAALAALYNGYAEKDYDKTEAMASFKEAEHYGEMAHDSLTTARAQYQMGSMLYNDYVHKDALFAFKKAETGFDKHYGEKSMTRNRMACCYINTKEYDSAAICLSQSLIYAELGNSNEARTKALNNYAVLYKLQGEYHKALDYLRMMRPENDEQQAINYLNLGDAFTALGEADSATHYYLELEKMLQKPLIKMETRCVAYDRLSKWSEHKGDMTSAMDYRKRYEGLLDSIRDTIEQKSIYRIQQKYDYEALQSEAGKDISRKQRWIIIISMISTVLFAALAVSQIGLARKRKQEAMINEKMLHFLHQNDLLAQSNTDYAKTLSEALEREIKSMVALELHLKDKKATSLKALEYSIFGKKNHWKALLEVIDKVYPGLWDTQLKMFPDLTENEQKTLLLSRFWLSRQEEALLLGTTVNMVDKLRGRVRKKTQSLLEKPE